MRIPSNVDVKVTGKVFPRPGDGDDSKTQANQAVDPSQFAPILFQIFAVSDPAAEPPKSSMPPHQKESANGETGGIEKPAPGVLPAPPRGSMPTGSAPQLIDAGLPITWCHPTIGRLMPQVEQTGEIASENRAKASEKPEIRADRANQTPQKKTAVFLPLTQGESLPAADPKVLGKVVTEDETQIARPLTDLRSQETKSQGAVNLQNDKIPGKFSAMYTVLQRTIPPNSPGAEPEQAGAIRRPVMTAAGPEVRREVVFSQITAARPLQVEKVGPRSVPPEQAPSAGRPEPAADGKSAPIPSGIEIEIVKKMDPPEIHQNLRSYVNLSTNSEKPDQNPAPEFHEAAPDTEAPKTTPAKTVQTEPVPLSSGVFPNARIRPNADAAGAKNIPDFKSQLDPEVQTKLVDHVVKQLAGRAYEKSSEIRILLKPESLGELSVRVRMDEGKMSAQIDVSQPAVKAALEFNLPRLREAITAQGIDIHRIDIFSAGNAPRQYSQQGHGPDAQHSGRRGWKGLEDEEDAASTRLMEYSTLELLI